MRVLKNCSSEYRNRVESVRVCKNGRIRASTGKGIIRASTEKLSRRVPEKGSVSESTGKRYNPCEYRKTVRASSGIG